MKPIGKDLARTAVFTKHALEQFEKRYRIVHPNDRFYGETTARKILAQTREDKNLDPIARIRRLIDNHGQPALYYINSGWRFIIIEEEGKFIVKTIERPI